MKRLTLTLLFLFVCVAANAAERPDLIVVVVIDQFPEYYLERFAPYFSDGGFSRFQKSGATFRNAHYTYASTFTAPGHATIGTGNTPSGSGIVGNNWFDRISGKSVYCVTDRRVHSVIEGGDGSFSPVNLQSDSLGDRLQEESPNSKVYGISVKDRAAILMAGRKANAAYWFDSKIPGFTSSTYYRDADLQLLADFNKTAGDYVKAHPVWTQSDFIPAAALASITHDPEELRKFKSNRVGLGLSFPHPVQSTEALLYTPFGNDIVLDFAEHLIETEKLGTADGAPDIVFVSLSSTDYLGHAFGPDSLEAADNVVRVDRELARFFDWLSTRFGDRVTVAFTADHGVQSMPEVAKELGHDGGRINLRTPKAGALAVSELSDGRREYEKRLARALGLPLTDRSPMSRTLLGTFEEPAIYMYWSHIRDLGLDAERVKRVARDVAKTLPGVATAFTNTELETVNPNASAVEQMVRRSFRADRSGDVIILLKPGWVWDYAGTGATHGQPVEADQHVPLMFWGDGIAPGSYEDESSPADLAKTLGALVGVDAGGADTHKLRCVSQ